MLTRYDILPYTLKYNGTGAGTLVFTGIKHTKCVQLQFPLITSNFNYLQLLEMENTGFLSQDFVKFIFR